MLIRIKFRKVGALRFIGHLDLMRTFQKIFRRAEVPVAYSEGFNPHQIFSIAAPLSLGVTSDAEYLDIKFKEDVDTTELIKKINETCPQGIEMLEAVELKGKVVKAMAAVAKAKYTVSGAFDTLDVDGFLKQETIMVQKKTKKGKLKEVDLKPGILRMTTTDEGLVMILSTGSAFNVKPAVVLEQLCLFSQVAYDKFAYKVHRNELYVAGSGYTNLIGKACNE